MQKNLSILERFLPSYLYNLIITSKNKKLLIEKNQIGLEIKNFLTKKDIKDYFFRYNELKVKNISTLKYRKKKGFNKSKKIYISFI
jgi:ribosomal protein L23